MAYRRRYVKRYRRRVYRKRQSGWAGTIRNVVKTVGFLKSVVNAEKKFIDTGVVSNVINNAGTMFYLSGVAQGTDQSTRNGNSIKYVQQFIRGSMVISPSANTSIVRMILFKDNDNQGAVPTAADLLANADVNGQLSQFNGKRFTIIRDKCYSLDINNRRTLTYKFFMKGGFHIKYGGSSATVSSQKENGIFLFIITNESTNLPSITYNSRIRFIDN